MMRQKHYIENILIQYSLQNKQNVQTLIQPNTQLIIDNNLLEDKHTFMSQVLYINIVGSLRYITDYT